MNFRTVISTAKTVYSATRTAYAAAYRVSPSLTKGFLYISSSIVVVTGMAGAMHIGNMNGVDWTAQKPVSEKHQKRINDCQRAADDFTSAKAEIAALRSQRIDTYDEIYDAPRRAVGLAYGILQDKGCNVLVDW